MKKLTGKFTPMRGDRFDAPAPGWRDDNLIDITPGAYVVADENVDATRRAAKLHRLYVAALEKLEPRERVIVIERIARQEPDKTTMEAIGQRFNISRERVRQIESHLKVQLRLEYTRAGARELLAA
jgi:RNA polymerase sigma factor (sigma-70 family)